MTNDVSERRENADERREINSINEVHEATDEQIGSIHGDELRGTTDEREETVDEERSQETADEDRTCFADENEGETAEEQRGIVDKQKVAVEQSQEKVKHQQQKSSYMRSLEVQIATLLVPVIVPVSLPAPEPLPECLAESGVRIVIVRISSSEPPAGPRPCLLKKIVPARIPLPCKQRYEDQPDYHFPVPSACCIVPFTPVPIRLLLFRLLCIPRTHHKQEKTFRMLRCLYCR